MKFYFWSWIFDVVEFDNNTFNIKESFVAFFFYYFYRFFHIQ